MGKKYYIPSLPYLRGGLEKDCKNIIVKDSEHLIELNTDTEIESFIGAVKNIEYVSDKNFYDFFKERLPEVANQINDIPISHEDLKGALRFIFNDLPEEAFESENIVECLTKIFNHVIRKNEITFHVTNIANGSLLCEQDYKYSKFQEFYFQMMKLEYNLDSYYSIYYNAQVALLHLFTKEILFSEEIISDSKEALLRRVFNLNGQALGDFKLRLEDIRNQIQSHRVTIKRTNIPLPAKYDCLEQSTLDKVNLVLADVNQKIDETYEAKNKLADEMKKRHGLLSKETAKKIMRENKWLKILLKE